MRDSREIGRLLISKRADINAIDIKKSKYNKILFKDDNLQSIKEIKLEEKYPT